ncbi:MAG: transposase [Faecousia sp.]
MFHSIVAPSNDKAKIVVAVSKAENGVPLFARMKVAENVQGKTLQEIIYQYVAPKTKVECAGYRNYLTLECVELNAKKYETDDLHLLHKAISNLKALPLGTYHGRCTKVQAYLDEYCFRFNRRMTGNQIFLRLTRAVATSCGVLS